ncbi:hypothetical protein [Siccirubricoccus sp. G192]|nr:hypothetical protein [Siccirubricoccus sp. G192]
MTKPMREPADCRSMSIEATFQQRPGAACVAVLNAAPSIRREETS